MLRGFVRLLRLAAGGFDGANTITPSHPHDPPRELGASHSGCAGPHSHFITGGGGAPLYDVDTPPEGITKKVESIENFMIVDVDGSKARFESKKPNGETLDVTELGK